MDALSDVLRVMRLTGGLFLHAEFSAPWCVSSVVKKLPEGCAPYLGENAHIIPYHYVLEGRMRVRLQGGAELEVGQGDSVLFPRNDSHLLGSDLKLLPVPGADIMQPPTGNGLATMVLGGGGAATRIVCGFLGSEEVRGNPVLGTVPPVLRVDGARQSSAQWIRSTFLYAAEEIAAGRMGTAVVAGKVSELLFVDAIRSYVETLADGHTGWLAALKDPFVSRAMTLLHAKVAAPWTVDELGREIGLSRSALGERFTRIIGMPPIQYLANWRIHAAAHEMINSSKPILQIAQEVGYDTEASFTRAFKRLMGAPPATWRRRRVSEG